MADWVALRPHVTPNAHAQGLLVVILMLAPLFLRWLSLIFSGVLQCETVEPQMMGERGHLRHPHMA